MKAGHTWAGNCNPALSSLGLPLPVLGAGREHEGLDIHSCVCARVECLSIALHVCVICERGECVVCCVCVAFV